jgi:four helix bundle protein
MLVRIRHLPLRLRGGGPRPRAARASGAPTAEALYLAHPAAAEMNLGANASAGEGGRHALGRVPALRGERPTATEAPGASPFSGGTGAGTNQQENANMSTFITYQVAIELVRELRVVVERIKRVDRDLADQIQRAASSVALNISEGMRLTAGNQRKHYEYASGSAAEVRAGLDLAEAWGWISDTDASRRTLDRLLALLWRLTHTPRLLPRASTKR